MNTTNLLLILALPLVADADAAPGTPPSFHARPAHYLHPATAPATMRTIPTALLSSSMLLAAADLQGNVFDATLLDHVGLRYPCFGEVVPVLKIQNTGTVVMTSCVVETWKNGISQGGFNWVLNDPAAPGEIREPQLPPVQGVVPGDALEFHILSVNDQPDENPSGNLLVVLLGSPEAADAPLVRLSVNTGSEPTLVGWRITDAEGGITAQAGPFTDAFTTYEQWLDLDPNSCYMVHLDQPGGASTEADLHLFSLGDEVLALGGPGGAERGGLTTGSSIGIAEGPRPHTLVFAPNPTSGPFTVRWNDVSARPDRVMISDATGRVILMDRIVAGGPMLQLDLSHLPSGHYVSQLFAADQLIGSGRVVIQH